LQLKVSKPTWQPLIPHSIPQIVSKTQVVSFDMLITEQLNRQLWWYAWYRRWKSNRRRWWSLL